jgi:drug/metabolite transporter (DMT)-like permease
MLPVHNDRVLKGIACACGAFFLFTVMQACAKILSENHHIAEIAFYRNLIFLPIFLAYLIVRRKLYVLKPKNQTAVYARGAFGAVSLMVTFGAFSRLPMADTTVLLFTATLLTPVLAHFFLREQIGPHRWGAVAAGFCGVLFMAGPTGQLNAVGVLLALAGAFLHAAMYILLRHLKTEDPLTVSFYFIFAGVIIQGMFMPFVAAPAQSLMEVSLFALIGLSGGFAQILITVAHKYAPASAISPFNYTGLIWATGLDILIWNTVPGWPVFGGAAMIIAANLYILHRERLLGGLKNAETSLPVRITEAEGRAAYKRRWYGRRASD